MCCSTSVSDWCQEKNDAWNVRNETSNTRSRHDLPVMRQQRLRIIVSSVWMSKNHDERASL